MENDEIVDIIDENSDEEILKRYMLKCLDQDGNDYLKKVISKHHIVVNKTDTPKRQKIKHKLKQDTDISKVRAINAVKEIISLDKSISGSNSSNSCASTTDIVAMSNYVINTLLEKKLKETEKKEAVQKNGNFMKFLVVLLPILFTATTNLIQYYTIGCHQES